MRELLDRRSTITADMRGLVAANNGELSQDQEVRFNSLKTDLDGIETRISRQSIIDEAERRVAGTPVGSGDRNFDRQLAEVGILDVIRAGMGATDRRAGLARENSEEMARRSGRTPQGLLRNMGAGADMERRVVTSTAPAGAAGGNIIGTDCRPDLFIDRLRARTIVRKLGARVLGGLVGPVDVPRLKTSATSGWVAENSALTPSDIGLEKFRSRRSTAAPSSS